MGYTKSPSTGYATSPDAGYHISPDTGYVNSVGGGYFPEPTSVSPFADAYAQWNIDAYEATPRPRIANAKAATAAAADLFTASRNLFANTQWWAGQSSTKTDNAATAPDGTTSASTIVGTGNWTLSPQRNDTLPAGTYTLACNAKRNTGSDQQFAFYIANTGTRSSAKTTTSAWQRFSYTFTIGASSTLNVIGLGSIDGVTDGNIQVCDFELYAGSSDLGPQTYAGHFYVGETAYDTRPSYASGALNLGANGFGLVQFGTTKTLTTFTAQALISKTAAGSAYHSFLSKVQNYLQFSMMTELSGHPQSLVSSDVIGPVQGAGLWVATSKGYHAITIRYDGTYLDYWLDDVRILRATKSLSAPAVTDLFVNITNDETLYGGSTYAGMMGLWDRALSDNEVRSSVVEQQARAAASSITATSATRLLIAEGDSITASTSPVGYVYAFGPNASPALYGVNYAVTGSAIADIVTRQSITLGIVPPNMSGRKVIVSVLDGANDLVALGATAWLTALASCLDTFRAAGMLVAICTPLPSTAVGYNTQRALVLTTMRAWVGVHADAVIDFAADATMGPDAAASDTTYYSDGTHPTTAGHVILEAVYRAGINAM